jgi:hypothetical protein
MCSHDGWDATVAIVIANRPGVYLLGTGTLFAIGGFHFVVTAAHIVKQAYKDGKTIGISDAQQSFISVHGNWIISAPCKPGTEEEPFDLAVYRLPDDAIARLNGKRFLRREDIDFSEQSNTAVFSILGYPGIWASPSRGDDELVTLKALEYTTYAHDGSTESLIGYDPTYHLLFGSDPRSITGPDGSRAVFVARNGRAASIPRELKGVSGCGVWVIGDLTVPLEKWPNRSPRVVAVETGIYHESRVVRATRWIAVTTLIHEAFEELRPALSLWTPE